MSTQPITDLPGPLIDDRIVALGLASSYTPSPEQRAAATRTLARLDALDLADMLGLDREQEPVIPRTGGRAAMRHTSRATFGTRVA